MMTVSKREKLQVTTRNDEKKPKSGADIVVQTLEQRGVEYVFGVPGAKIDKIFDSLVDSKIRTVVCRHEQNAAFIAGGIGRMTGKAGVAIATSGPGVSNLVTGLATANTEGDPVVALGGAVQVSDRLKKIHQTMDSVSLCKPVTKYSAEVDSSESVSEVLTNAFRSAESDRPGAAFVSLPMDIMVARAECDVLVPPAYSGGGPADIAGIRETARLINQAERPVVLLGLLASKPQNAVAVQELIKSGRLPVVGTFQAAGAVSASLFSNFAGRVGQINNQPADEILAGSDLVITVGYDPVEYWPSIWNQGKKRPIVHLDVLPADIDNSYNPSVELVGDIASTLVHLTPLVSRSALEPSVKRLLERIANDREELARSSAGLSGTPVHPLRIAAELQRILTPDTTLCLDMGSFHLWMARHLYSFRARQILISNGQQTLGVALPWAIAATLVRPSEKVLSISGDGGFLFSAMELETAVRLKSNLVHMILIDGSYDMVAEQEILKYNRPSGTDFGPVDPVKYAEAFGAKGLMVRSPEQIPSVLKQAFDTSGPVLVGVHVDDRDNRKMFEQVDERSIH
jgi:acetolactate synthase I/II/III large subunit